MNTVDSLINGVISTSEKWGSSFSKVFGYGLKEKVFITSCE